MAPFSVEQGYSSSGVYEPGKKRSFTGVSGRKWIVVSEENGFTMNSFNGKESRYISAGGVVEFANYYRVRALARRQQAPRVPPSTLDTD